MLNDLLAIDHVILPVGRTNARGGLQGPTAVPQGSAWPRRPWTISIRDKKRGVEQVCSILRFEKGLVSTEPAFR